MKTIQEQVTIFKDKTERIKNTPSTKKKLIYTSNYIVKLVSCAFANDINAELENWDVETSSNALMNALNKFFSRGDKPVKTLIERGFQPWRSLYKLSKTRGLIENKQ